MTTEKTKRIAELNDLFRTGIAPSLGQTVYTSGVNSLSAVNQFAISHRVRGYTDFSEDDNPYGERDFGAFEHGDKKVFWKIDYYNRTLDGGSPDPSDPAKTCRVLTIMLAQEY